MKHIVWFFFGLLVGFTALTFSKAAVLIKNKVTDDTAISQKMSEIQVSKEPKANFDGDIQRLSDLESRYIEKLPNQRPVPQRK